MRSKKALINTASGLIYEMIAVICGLILPRLILGYFGSKYNGITSSISQFLSCIALMKAGIGGASNAAFYKALAKKDNYEISAIVKTTQSFMNKIAAFFVAFIAVFSILYAAFFSKEFGFLFTVSLIIIISISTFGEYFFGYTYERLLGSDQCQYVFSFIRIFTTILNTIIASLLIVNGFGIHAVKLVSSLVFLINPIFIKTYARRKYHIDDKVLADNNLLSQRWDAVAHEVANFINTNTDIMVLTFFTNVMEVSVYTVYNTVIMGVRKVVYSFVTGFGAAFGNMYAKGEMELMEKNFRIYELIVFSMVSVIYTITAIMFVPYANLYTSGVYDVNYARPIFAYIITMAGAFSCIRIPYQNIVMCAGHFKQTKNGAFVEAILNICISIVCVIKIGLVGVAIGTVVANVFRTVQYVIYMSNHVLKRSKMLFIKHLLIFIAVFVFTNLISYSVFNLNCITAIDWIATAIEVAGVALILTIATDYLFYKSDLMSMLRKLNGALRIKNRNNNA